MNKILKYSAAAFLSLALIAALSYYIFLSPNFIPSNDEKSLIKIGYNTTVPQLINQIDSLGYLNSRWTLSIVARMLLDDTIPVGAYAINSNTSNAQLIMHIKHQQQTPINVLINNRRLKETISGLLAKQLLNIDSTTLISALKDTAIIHPLGFTEPTIIALFIPNTYQFYWTASQDELITKLKKEYDAFWSSRTEQAKKIEMTPIEVAILASIVDEETNIKRDKEIIAGLYINRIKRGIPMQACPTARYAVGDFSLNQILLSHTKVESPYNTYLNKGLPIGPIRVASIEGIDAVLNYQPSNYIYMCAKETLNGEHAFAETLSEHNRNAAKYHKALRAYLKNKQEQSK